jgi:hypothetical protein
MPTNAEIKATIDLLIRQPKSSILTNSIADMLDDIVDNITGGPSGIDSVLAEAQALTTDREINIGGHELEIVDSANRIFFYLSEPERISYVQSDDGTAKTFFASYANLVGSTVFFHISSTGGGNVAEIRGDSITGEIEHTSLSHNFNGLIKANSGLNIGGANGFADNAAALAAGVPSGCLYYSFENGDRTIKQAHD